MKEPEQGVYTIKVNHPKRGEIQVSIFRTEGQEYLNMENAELYLGVSKHTTYKLIDQWESEGKLQRYDFGGMSKWMLRSDLDKIKQERARPRPATPRRPLNEKP